MVIILHLIDTARIGGPGKTILNSARFIDHERFQIHVGTFTSSEVRGNEFASAVSESGIPLLSLTETRRFNLGHVAAIRAYVRTHGVQIVHAHGYKSDVLSWLATRGLDVALVTTHHGWIRNSRRQALFTRIAARLSTQFDGIEVVSQRLLDELPSRLRLSGRAAVMHNAVVLDDYTPIGVRDQRRRELGLNGSEVLLGVIGRLSIEKGCLEMLAAFDAVLATHQHARLVFIGEGSLEGELRNRIAQRNLSWAAQLVPHQKDVRSFYEALDVLVCPSRTEGLSNVIMEAMAYGLPVVATHVGGNSELVEDRVTGLLVAPQQPTAMAEGLNQLISNLPLRQQLGVAARARVGAAFSFESRMRREEAFYDKMLTARRP
jgi:glycosyltransferase involved in cell wall biosynthesis